MDCFASRSNSSESVVHGIWPVIYFSEIQSSPPGWVRGRWIVKTLRNWFFSGSFFYCSLNNKKEVGKALANNSILDSTASSGPMPQFWAELWCRACTVQEFRTYSQNDLPSICTLAGNHRDLAANPSKNCQGIITKWPEKSFKTQKSHLVVHPAEPFSWDLGSIVF